MTRDARGAGDATSVANTGQTAGESAAADEGVAQVQPADLMRALLDLADELSLEVRSARPRAAGDEPPVASAVCRVKGRVWVVLSHADPVDVQLAVLAGAIRRHAGESLDDRYLPPALRALLEAEDGA